MKILFTEAFFEIFNFNKADSIVFLSSAINLNHLGDYCVGRVSKIT